MMWHRRQVGRHRVGSCADQVCRKFSLELPELQMIINGFLSYIPVPWHLQPRKLDKVQGYDTSLHWPPLMSAGILYAGLKSMLLEKRVEVLSEALEMKDAQLGEVLAAAHLDPATLQQVRLQLQAKVCIVHPVWGVCLLVKVASDLPTVLLQHCCRR